MLNCFRLIPEHHGRTDRQTDGQNCYINITRQYADAKKSQYSTNIWLININ